jgi:putative membrane protein
MKNILLTALSIVILSACRTGTDTELKSALSTMTSSSTATNMITDADNAAIVRAINDGEIQMAQVALTNASSQAVRDFAQMMITDHTNANNMLQQNGYGKMRNPVTDVLDATVSRQMAKLRGMSGTSFDQAYIASQVDMHQTALETVNGTLLPSAQDDRLKGLLGTVRQSVETHLAQARSLNSGGTMPNM